MKLQALKQVLLNEIAAHELRDSQNVANSTGPSHKCLPNKTPEYTETDFDSRVRTTGSESSGMDYYYS